jgi:uncharacterized protein (DUF1501 family)
MQRYKCHPKLNRRGFLHVGAAATLGLGLETLLLSRARADTPHPSRVTAKHLILVWLSGGPATIDMWDMKPKAPREIRGEFTAIASSQEGIEICEHMPRMAEQMHRCCLIRSCSHTLAAHGPGTQLLLTGNRPNPAMEFPALGSSAVHEKAPACDVPGYIALGDGLDAGPGYLGAAYDAFRCEPTGGRFSPANISAPIGLPDGFSVDDLQRRHALLKQLDQQAQAIDHTAVSTPLSQFQQQAFEMLRSNKTRAALDISAERENVQEQYGMTPTGRRLLAARRLVEAGVPIVTVGMSGWDTHGNNFATLRTQLLPELDRALGALITDLAERGLLASTLIYCTGEFGRTPDINAGAGRDHWARAMTCLLAGGPVQQGHVYGSTDSRGYEPTDLACSPMDVSATVLAAIGIPPETIMKTPAGRPLPIIAEGKVLKGILG